MIVACGHPATSLQRVGWVETRLGLHSYSIALRRRARDQLLEVDPSTLALDPDLLQLLAPIKTKKWFADKISGDAESFARAFQTLVSDLVPESEVAKQNSQHHALHLLVSHLNDIGWQRLVALNADMTVITLRIADPSGRLHTVELDIPPSYPMAAPGIQVALPTPVELAWPHRSPGDLNLVVAAVERALQQHEIMFAALEDIDLNCWVLEPLQPTFASTARRIAIEKSCSVLVELRPEDPFGLCNLRLLGPQARTVALQQHLGQNMHRWSATLPVRRNLEVVLGVELPQRDRTARAGTASAAGIDMMVECGICYNYTLGGGGVTVVGHPMSMSIPDQVCPHSRCSRVYHRSCLSSWLQAVPSSRTSFGTTFGSCPYCGEWLSVGQ